MDLQDTFLLFCENAAITVEDFFPFLGSFRNRQYLSAVNSKIRSNDNKR